MVVGYYFIQLIKFEPKKYTDIFVFGMYGFVVVDFI